MLAVGAAERARINRGGGRSPTEPDPPPPPDQGSLFGSWQGLASHTLQPHMDAMNYPSPEDPGRAPVWENYVVAQAVQAALGLIPEHALAVGVEVVERDVRLRFQLTEVTEHDEADMNDIVSELEGLVGPDVHVEMDYEVRERRAVSPRDGMRWIFLVRA